MPPPASRNSKQPVERECKPRPLTPALPTRVLERLHLAWHPRPRPTQAQARRQAVGGAPPGTAAFVAAITSVIGGSDVFPPLQLRINAPPQQARQAEQRVRRASSEMTGCNPGRTHARARALARTHAHPEAHRVIATILRPSRLPSAAIAEPTNPVAPPNTTIVSLTAAAIFALGNRI